uniref:Uncharacterized protein n=1 Tax=Oryza brachyantha TaxID=4533 RepID=J3MKD1_ORYBR
MTASAATRRPSTSSAAPPRSSLRIPGTTSMSPERILASAPMSSTGVLPLLFLSSSGPPEGLVMPSLARSPRKSHARRTRILSTSQSGRNRRGKTATEKVATPSISRGRTCTFSLTTMEGRALWWQRSRHTSMPELPQPTTSTRLPRYASPDL